MENPKEEIVTILDINENYVPAQGSFHFLTSNESIVIDLTEEDDEVPPLKKVIIANNGRGEYFTVNRSDNQPGPSGIVQRKNPESTGRCVTCESKTLAFIDLQCDHRVCYDCFNVELKKTQKTVIMCPHPTCQQLIADGEIKDFLTPADYISFLEHSRDVLRNLLELRNLEMSFLSTKSHHGSEETSSQHSTDDVVIIQEPKIQQRRRSELIHLQNLDNLSFVKNTFAFECPVCLMDIKIGDGLILKNCLHTLCNECFCNHVKMCDDPEVLCPYNSPEGSCEFLISAREIRAIVPPELYEMHQLKGLKRAETALENIYHCKTPDCGGFFQHDEDRSAFVCTVCDKVNCIKCKTIHEVSRKFITIERMLT